MYDIPRDLLRPQEFTCEERDMFYSEVLIPQLLPKTSYLTKDPNEAHFFLVPQHIACCFHHCLFKQRRQSEDCSAETVVYMTNILRYIQNEYPYWNLTKGTDHVFVFCWGRGMGVMGPHVPLKEELRNAIHLTTYGRVNFFFFVVVVDVFLVFLVFLGSFFLFLLS